MSEVDGMIAAATGREQELATPGMSARPGRRTVVLTCMDVRIDPLRLLGLERGDAHVLRNAGGLVDRKSVV